MTAIRSGLKRLILGLLVLLLGMSVSLANPAPALARLLHEEIAPGEQLYKSLRTLNDNHGYSWQVIAFKHINSTSNAPVFLRLVSFPGTIEIDHHRPLLLEDSFLHILSVEDITQDVFNHTLPAPNVAQYPLESILPTLSAKSRLTLTVAGMDGSTRELRVPPVVVQEWQAIAACQSIVCN